MPSWIWRGVRNRDLTMEFSLVFVFHVWTPKGEKSRAQLHWRTSMDRSITLSQWRSACLFLICQHLVEVQSLLFHWRVHLLHDFVEDLPRFSVIWPSIQAGIRGLGVEWAVRREGFAPPPQEGILVLYMLCSRLNTLDLYCWEWVILLNILLLLLRMVWRDREEDHSHLNILYSVQL